MYVCQSSHDAEREQTEQPEVWSRSRRFGDTNPNHQRQPRIFTAPPYRNSVHPISSQHKACHHRYPSRGSRTHNPNADEELEFPGRKEAEMVTSRNFRKGNQRSEREGDVAAISRKERKSEALNRSPAPPSLPRAPSIPQCSRRDLDLTPLHHIPTSQNNHVRARMRTRSPTM
jgi:hypothetical protein